MRTVLCMLLLVALQGCMSTPERTVAQIRAQSADKNAAFECVQINGTWGTARYVSSNLDQGVIGAKNGGTVKIDSDRCNAEITIHPPQPAPVKP